MRIQSTTAAPKDHLPERVTTSVNLAILTYNGRELTAGCLEHLARHTEVPHSVFVVDNASTDGTGRYLQERAAAQQNLYVHYSDRNLGVAGGRNRLRQILLDRIPEDGFLIFLDNDIDVGEGWCEPFLALFERRPEVGIAAHAGSVIVVHEESRQLMPTPERASPVDVVSGGFACWMRAAVCREVGEFDESLGLFWQEDDDYCLRALQCDWEIWSVPEAPMVHHEHGSGVALSELQQGGSAKNARYLAEKWRRIGCVDEQGWAVHQTSSIYLPPAQRRELLGYLGRRCGFDRQEFAAALHRVHRVVEQPEIALAEPKQCGSRLEYLLLDLLESEFRSDGDRDRAAQVVAARANLEVEDYRHWLHTELRFPLQPPGSTRGTLCKLCTASDWDDPEWRADAELISWDPSGPGFHLRSRFIWEQVQLLYGLRRLGAVHPQARGLAFGAGRGPLLWALANEIALLTAADAYGERDEHAFVRAPQDFATRSYREAALQVVDWSSRDAAPEVAGGFDFAYCGTSLSNYGIHGSASVVLRALANSLRSGGVVAVTVDVQLNDRPEGAGLYQEQVGRYLEEASGLQLVEQPDLILTEDTIEGFRAGPTDPARLPYFLHRCGELLVTSAVAFLRKP